MHQRDRATWSCRRAFAVASRCPNGNLAANYPKESCCRSPTSSLRLGMRCVTLCRRRPTRMSLSTKAAGLAAGNAFGLAQARALGAKLIPTVVVATEDVARQPRRGFRPETHGWHDVARPCVARRAEGTPPDIVSPVVLSDRPLTVARLAPLDSKAALMPLSQRSGKHRRGKGGGRMNFARLLSRRDRSVEGDYSGCRHGMPKNHL